MIYVTGDTHGLNDFHKLHVLAGENPNLTRDDYAIIAGDFGGVWSKETLVEWLRPYKELPFTVLFVDGNHENFDMLESYPTEIWNGGKIHRIADNIIHLMRGQVFNIEGRTIFSFGGGTSIDRGWRVQGRSWWPQELPTMEEYDEALKNLKEHNFKVDFIITHSCDERALYYPPLSSCGKAMTTYPDNRTLTNFEEMVDYGHWYFGHYHVDGDLTDRKTALCHNIIRIN